MAACVSPLIALFTAVALAAALRLESCHVLPALCHDREQGWRYLDGRAGWQSAEVDVFYAGAWLLGISCNGRHYWVWPDSAERDALWRFRRCCRSLPVRHR
ncbi:hypothetical protein [Larsenimonas rhizosphaerae]|uniref:Uncharacterized protein n=1 Tax=Larsenimonas rhizosphaerae TaxID=2944682 RepID=A0AA41ZE39_9GAMM|nr:hypothetical protein [Larsenimonas rhizosphaerae]MCX2523599.1 hypothetical protein [Larsenimonas rhizosphaerae]